MAIETRSVLLLAGRLRATYDGRPVLPFLERLARLGVEAQVLCLSAGAGAGGDYRVIECPNLGRRWRRLWAVRRLRLGEGLRRPDLIHVLQTDLGEMGMALAERWRVPYVQTVPDYLDGNDRLRISRKWCRGLIAASRELAGELVRERNVPPAFLALVYPGIDVAAEVPEPSPAALPRVPVIGTAGPLKEQSGFVTFLNAARRVLDRGIDVEFVIAGQGEDEGALRRRAERLRIAERVTFAGIPVVGLRYWNVLNIFCQPATVPTVGRALALALAFGVPAIASDIEGLRALIVHGESGLLVPPENSGALAEAMLTLLNDRAAAQRLGRQGQALIRRDFDPETESQRLVEVYGRALAPAAASRPRFEPAL